MDVSDHHVVFARLPTDADSVCRTDGSGSTRLFVNTGDSGSQVGGTAIVLHFFATLAARHTAHIQATHVVFHICRVVRDVVHRTLTGDTAAVDRIAGVFGFRHTVLDFALQRVSHNTATHIVGSEDGESRRTATHHSAVVYGGLARLGC